MFQKWPHPIFVGKIWCKKRKGSTKKTCYMSTHGLKLVREKRRFRTLSSSGSEEKESLIVMFFIICILFRDPHLNGLHNYCELLFCKIEMALSKFAKIEKYKMFLFLFGRNKILCLNRFIIISGCFGYLTWIIFYFFQISQFFYFSLNFILFFFFFLGNTSKKVI